MQPIIGIDFDNTIICYDEVFHKVAVEKGLIPQETPKNKEYIRNYLRQMGQDTLWAELQGFIFGTRMRDATPFPGVIDFFRAARDAGVQLYIITHKTLYPYLGPEYDLHKTAKEWLEWQGFFDPAGIGMSPKSVYFELSIDEKLERIHKMHCTHFIDDLPEFFHKADFPNGVSRLLFHPPHEGSIRDHAPNYKVCQSWHDIQAQLVTTVQSVTA
jgi:hypothetical protein